jgi:hypothetical protein
MKIFHLYKFFDFLFRIDSKIDVLLLEELAVIIGGLSDNNIILRDIKQGLKQKI